MKAQDLYKARSSELRASLDALRRAAALARKTAIQTNTDLLVVKDGELIRISGEQLRLDDNKSKAV